ncbi:MAG TPA: DsbA family protein [Nevskiaceae bacterium]|nr:DsbA family protein [Nevskiaceae bacterium]
MRRIADPRLREQRRVAAEAKRRKDARPHEVLYFHQPDDPYSHLAAQALRPFLDRYDVRLRAHVVDKPTPIAIHEQALWDAWARRECAAMAPFYGLRYADRGAPNVALTDLARRILLRAEETGARVAPYTFPEIAVAVGEALNAGDAARMKSLSGKHGAADTTAARNRLDANFALRHRLGHYLGAMLFYEGEWYWGIDRLHHLEARLDTLGARRAGAPAGPTLEKRRPEGRPSMRRPEGRPTIKLEFFPSLRSPYTHLSYTRVADLAQRYPIDLVVRPVLPMMMRGVKADRRKGVYILQDTMREAERLGIPFGNIWDPFGDPVRRAYSLFPWARDRGKGFEYLHQYSLAVWSERVNAWSLDGLKQIVERAGLSWDEAKPLVDNRDWEDEFEHNVSDMLAAGSWGVPTLRLPPSDRHPEFTVWGQDRIWLVEEEIMRRSG